MNDVLARFEAMQVGGLLLVDINVVNLDDLCRALDLQNWPFAIVRVDGCPLDAIQVVAQPDDPATGCVAGWISEHEA